MNIIKPQTFIFFLSIVFFTVSCKEISKEENSINNISEGKQNDRIKVAFLIYPEIAILDMTGPMDAFIKINRMTENQYEVYTVSATTELIKTQGHIIETKAKYTFENAPKPDILIIPGAKIDVVQNLADDSAYANYIIETSAIAKYTMSVCTGAFTIGKLGLLDDRKATTHWYLANKFANDFPKTQLVRDVRYVEDEKFITTSGVTAGIDGAIALITKYSGDHFSEMVSRGLQHQTKEKDTWPSIPAKPMNHGDSVPED